jgi:hypothetical protein
MVGILLAAAWGTTRAQQVAEITNIAPPGGNAPNYSLKPYRTSTSTVASSVIWFPEPVGIATAWQIDFTVGKLTTEAQSIILRVNNDAALDGYNWFPGSGASGVDSTNRNLTASSTTITWACDSSGANTTKVFEFELLRDGFFSNPSQQKVTIECRYDNTPPTAPKITSVIRNGNSAIIDWDPAIDLNASGTASGSGVYGYIIYRDGNELARQAAINANFFIDSTISTTATRTYTYTLKAIDAVGNLGPASNAGSLQVVASTAGTVGTKALLLRTGSSGERDWKAMIESAGGTIDEVEAGTFGTSSFDASPYGIIAFFAVSNTGGLGNQGADKVLTQVRAGATYVTNGIDAGAAPLVRAGLAVQATDSNQSDKWSQLLLQNFSLRFENSTVGTDPLMSGVSPGGEFSSYAFPAWGRIITAYTQTPDRYLAQGRWRAGSQAGAIENWYPEWKLGSGRIVLLENYLFPPSAGAGAGYTTAARRVLQNILGAGGSSSGGSGSSAPVITSNPASTSITAGQSTTLSVSASGSGLTYQWYRGSSGDTANPIAGATSASYTTGALSSSASFWVRVTNASGRADSATATINVGADASLTSFTDSFDALDLGRWEIVGGSWSVASSRITGTWSQSQAQTDQGNLLLKGGLITGNYTAEFSAALVNGQGIGFSLYQSAGNKYTVYVDSTSVNVARRLNGANYVQVASQTFTGLSPGATAAVKLTRTGATFAVFINGTQVLTFTDGQWGGNLRLGLGVYGTAAYDSFAYTVGAGSSSGSAPSAPASLAATAVSSGEVSLSWPDISGETLYRIERRTGSGAFGALTTKFANVTIHSDTTVTAGTSYTYQIRAENASGNSSYTLSNTVTTPAAATTPPPAPAPSPAPSSGGGGGGGGGAPSTWFLIALALLAGVRRVGGRRAS